ncbi:DUF1569 domain-containing protein [Ferruginibacter sp.]|uniref:DUF1569 domain-containing protein n=1 Tax=Ferruginibacter sp. TaxID=1940288 RepID=UPI00374DD68D
MSLPNIFYKEVSDKIIERINYLNAESKPQWGTMSVAQIPAHCNVSYEMIYENIHPKPNAFLKFILKILVKNKVVGELPYPHNSKTAPQFIIKETKNFEAEKQRLIDYSNKTQQLGENYFDNKEFHLFGKLNKIKWNNMLYKHLQHHLSQFGV